MLPSVIGWRGRSCLSVAHLTLLRNLKALDCALDLPTFLFSNAKTTCSNLKTIQRRSYVVGVRDNSTNPYEMGQFFPWKSRTHFKPVGRNLSFRGGGGLNNWKVFDDVMIYDIILFRLCWKSYCFLENPWEICLFSYKSTTPYRRVKCPHKKYSRNYKFWEGAIRGRKTVKPPIFEPRTVQVSIFCCKTAPKWQIEKPWNHTF